MSVVELDPEIVEAMRRIEEAGTPAVQTQTPEEARATFARSVGMLFGEVDEVASVEDLDANGVPIRVYRPEQATGLAHGLVYFHGGGWVVGSVDTHDGITRALARRAGCVVVSVDYRLAPEHPFPAAHDDAWTAARWVLEHATELGLDEERIGVAGDSVGGNLAAVVARRGRDHGMPFAAQLLLYPTTTTRTDAPSFSLFASGYGLTREAMRWYWQQYIGDADGSSNPDLSPSSLMDLRRLPRAIVVTAEADVLRDEAETYAQRMFLAGIETEGYRYDGMIHGFLRMAGVVERSQKALDEIAESLRPALAKGWREDFSPSGAPAEPS